MQYSPIKSHNFNVGWTSGYLQKKQKRRPFLFGATKSIPFSELNTLLRQVVYPSKYPSSFYTIDGGGDVVLVGHEIRSDMALMDTYFPEIWTNCPIKAFIDTTGLHGRIRLESVLRDLEIGREHQQPIFHCGGNDANYTLREVLLSAVLDFESKQSAGVGSSTQEPRRETAERIREIALFGICRRQTRERKAFRRDRKQCGL